MRFAELSCNKDTLYKLTIFVLDNTNNMTQEAKRYLAWAENRKESVSGELDHKRAFELSLILKNHATEAEKLKIITDKSLKQSISIIHRASAQYLK